jgi:hypothetical protein
MLIALSTVLVRSNTVKAFSVKSPNFQTYHLLVRGAPTIAYLWQIDSSESTTKQQPGFFKNKGEREDALERKRLRSWVQILPPGPFLLFWLTTVLD